MSLKHSETSEYSDGLDDSAKVVKAEHTEDSAKAVKAEHMVGVMEDSAKAVKAEHTKDSDENNNVVQDSGIVKEADVAAQSDSSDEDCEVLKCKEILHASDAEGPPMVYSSEVKLESSVGQC